MPRNAAIVVTVIAAIAGLGFASVSTYDFVQHLDRQVHGLHCSFLPGVEAADISGESGCHVTLMSPYSSVLRETFWGGLPISLPAMAVFAFLLAAGLFILITRRSDERAPTGLLLIAWLVPTTTSVVMGVISFATLNAACKLCIGIYASSAVGLLAALYARYRADYGETELKLAAVAAATLGLFVLVPVGAYAMAAPNFDHYVGSCGTLENGAAASDVLVPIGSQTNSVPVLEVLDPLCPACKGFEARFSASSIPTEASRKLLLFPLDNSCNWMVDRAIHPGACSISEAVLCADEEAEDVIAWAFEHQEEITSATREDDGAAARMASERFPMLADCIGSPRVRARLNQALRWAVDNQLPVLTPQVYVGHLRLCDADTDLGMDYALTRLIKRYQASPEPPAAPQDTSQTGTGAAGNRPEARSNAERNADSMRVPTAMGPSVATGGAEEAAATGTPSPTEGPEADGPNANGPNANGPNANDEGSPEGEPATAPTETEAPAMAEVPRVAPGEPVPAEAPSAEPVAPMAHPTGMQRGNASMDVPSTNSGPDNSGSDNSGTGNSGTGNSGTGTP